MTEQGKSFQEQKQLKLRIEDELPKYLDGDMLKAALDFVAHMRANKMPLSWQSSGSWKAMHKGQNVCVIRLSKGSWCVVPRISRHNKLISSYNMYANEIAEQGLQDIVLANVNFCRRCANCGPGWDMTFLGRDFEDVCHNVPVRYVNPDEREIDCIKKVLELMKSTVGEESKRE